MPTLKIQKADGTFEFLQLAGEEFADIGNQVLDVKSQLAQTTKHIKLSEFGLSESQSEASNNFTKLCQAIESGDVLYVDAFYPIKVTTPYTFSQNVKRIKLISLFRDYGFNWDVTSDYVFSVPHDLELIDLWRLKMTGTANIIFYNMDMQNLIKVMRVEDCDFSDKIVLNYFRTGYENTNFNSFGVREISFKRNKLTNITHIFNGQHTSEGRTLRGFMMMRNLPFKLIEVEGNEVRNFVNSILYTDVGDTTYSQNSLNLIEHRELVEIHNNVAINDIDFFSNSSQARYHTFAFVEAITLNYSNNHVEGLKAIDQQVYDVYANCRFVHSENNRYKNNVQLRYDVGDSEYLVSNCLMKAKGNPSPSGVFGRRRYKNNEYLIEESYVTGLGYEKKWSTVLLYETSGGNQVDWIIEDCKINVPVVRFQGFSFLTREITIRNTKIQAKAITNSLLNNQHEKAVLTLDNVEIETDTLISDLNDYKLSSTFNFSQFSIINQGLPFLEFEKLDIKNCKIKADFVSSIVSGGSFNYFISKGNSFTDLKENIGGNSTFFNPITVKNRLEIDQSITTGRNTPTVIRTHPVSGHVRSIIDAKDLSGFVMLRTNDYVSGTGKPFFVDITLKTLNGFDELNANFKLKFENGKLTHKNASGNLIENTLTGTYSGTAIYINPTSGSMPVRFRLFDDASNQHLSSSATSTIENVLLEVNVLFKKLG